MILRAFARLSVGPTKKIPQTRDDSLERMMGVGPTSQAWEARILPMYYTRDLYCENIIHLKTYYVKFRRYKTDIF